MDDDELPEDFIWALQERYEGWELVELLGIDIADIVEAFEDRIKDKYEELCEELGYQGYQSDAE